MSRVKFRSRVKLPSIHDWRTTDAHEIERRRMRAMEEYRNLESVHERIRPHMIRRRKADVEIRECPKLDELAKILEESRDPMRQAVLFFGQAHALEIRIPEPDCPEKAVDRCLAASWGEAYPKVRAFVQSAERGERALLEVMEVLGEKSPRAG